VRYHFHPYNTRRSSSFWAYFYWIGQMCISASSIACFVVRRRTDCVAITSMSLIIGFIGTFVQYGARSREHNSNKKPSRFDGFKLPFDSSKYGPRIPKYMGFLRFCNRLLKGGHLILYFTFGLLLIDLNAAYKYTNPYVTLEGFYSRKMLMV
jgi:hypothetical protein